MINFNFEIKVKKQDWNTVSLIKETLVLANNGIIPINKPSKLYNFKIKAFNGDDDVCCYIFSGTNTREKLVAIVSNSCINVRDNLVPISTIIKNKNQTISVKDTRRTFNDITPTSDLYNVAYRRIVVPQS